jgi:diguanylate cyclase (GGDEF)-like protein
MDKKLNILILEDVPTDAELVERELRKVNIAFSSKRVETKEAFLKELKDFAPDLILSDYTIPSFDGITALKITQEKCPDVPFIFISGTLGEELAIETLKMGATDYVLKERLSRLAPAVRRALNEAEERTKRKRAEEQLLHNAFHDALTGLPNRALFIDRLRQSIRRIRRRRDYLFAVLFLDLDNFKNINDDLGHMAGDQLLIAIARRLEACLRSSDTLARLGGDEFTILLDDIKDISDSIRVANRIYKELTPPFNLDRHEVFTTASIGIALSATGYDQPEDILRDADTAMHHAKTFGKTRHEVFDSSMQARATTRLQLETELQQAVERQEFRIYYQPIVSLETSRITSFEALVRWQHPQRGIVSPAEFISVAEKTGLIIPIGQWVLREACRQTRTWQAQFPKNQSLSISVNLSDKQLTQPNLIEQIDQILRETDLDARSLKLEIMENVITENPEPVAKMLLQLRDLGVQFSIDDFGTGYSSLSYLYHFPFDTLKIDQSFISGMGINNDNSEIIRTIIMLAYNLGMNVTAEGVETAGQLAQLRNLECEHGQGYYFSRPVDSETASALIAAQPRW